MKIRDPSLEKQPEFTLPPLKAHTVGPPFLATFANLKSYEFNAECLGNSWFWQNKNKKKKKKGNRKVLSCALYLVAAVLRPRITHLSHFPVPQLPFLQPLLYHSFHLFLVLCNDYNTLKRLF